MCALSSFIFCLYQGYSTSLALEWYALPGQHFLVNTTLTLAAGSAIITHLLDEVQTQGLGDGISLCIFVRMLQSKHSPSLQTSLLFLPLPSTQQSLCNMVCFDPHIQLLTRWRILYSATTDFKTADVAAPWDEENPPLSSYFCACRASCCLLEHWR